MCNEWWLSPAKKILFSSMEVMLDWRSVSLPSLMRLWSTWGRKKYWRVFFTRTTLLLLVRPLAVNIVVTFVDFGSVPESHFL